MRVPVTRGEPKPGNPNRPVLTPATSSGDILFACPLPSYCSFVVIPVAYCYLFSPVFSDPLVNGVMITMAAMPAAANTAIFAEQYGADARLASQIVFVSTIGSLVTIPLMTTVLL